MRTIARFMDARNTAEGKFLSVLLSVLLVFSFLNVTMFTDYAGADTTPEGDGTEIVDPVEDVDEPEAQPEDTSASPRRRQTKPRSSSVPMTRVVSDDTTKDSSEEPKTSEVEVELQLVDVILVHADKEYSDGDKLVVPTGQDLKFSVKAAEGAEVKVAATIGDEDVVLSPEADGQLHPEGRSGD